MARLNNDDGDSPVAETAECRDVADLCQLQAQALSAIGNAVVITNRSGIVVWANPAFEQLTGYPLSEVAGQSTRILKSGQNPRELYEDLWQTILSGTKWSGELVNRRKDGTFYHEEMSIAPVKNDAGSITHFVAVKRDITVRKHLAERMQMLANAVENSPNLIAMTGANDCIVYANLALVTSLRRSRADLLGKHFRELVSKNNPPELLQRLADPGGFRGECLAPRGDGSDLTALLSISPILGENGETLGLLGIGQDITEQKRAEKDLVFKNALLQAQAETTIDGILAVDPGNRIILSNQRFAEIWKIPQELIDAGDDAPLLRHVTDQIENAPEFLRKVEYLYDHRDEKSKDEIWLKDGTALERYSSPLRDPYGNYLGRIWYFRDITQRIQSEERLKLWSKVLEQSAEGIFICDSQERIVVVNAAFEQLTGFSAVEAIGQTPRILQSGCQDAAFYSEMWKTLLRTGVWRGEMWNRRKDGDLYAEWLSISVVPDRTGVPTYFVGIFSDVTGRKQDHERIVHLAQYDALTDLPNRVLLLDRLTEMIAAAERDHTKVAVMFIDLDHFKEVNDSLGHDAGDLLLQAVSKRLSATVRRGQDTVARMGGDEFVILFPALESLRDLTTVAHKLLSCLLSPVIVNQQELTVTTSMGIALYPDDAIDAQALIRNADAAMYQAKAAGRNNFKFFTGELHRRALEMLSTENALRRAIERGEFVLYYQPQVNLENGLLVGAEALIRWNRPDAGLVMPGKFITIAEERGLIVPIGNWVMEEACRQAAVWQRSSDLSVSIAINVSPVQFHHRDFVENLVETVHRHGIACSCLDLELTEVTFVRDPQATAAKLKTLHRMGFHLSIDDFGTGYSSLNYLRRFSFDKIKIDRSFVMDANAANIVTAVISLARSLNLKVIAEGVETREQVESLRTQHCDEAQGFLFGPAVSAPEFEKSIGEWKRDFDSNNPFRKPLTYHTRTTSAASTGV